jgi:gamma-glutamyltranspeptidase/glutathione hydrolase
MLDRGGNAYDAAVAAALAETVLLPPKCGLGGDLVALVWEPAAPEPIALLAIGGAPSGLAAIAAAGGLEETGPMAVGVPAAPSGYAALSDRGRLGRVELARPAAVLARDGFCWSTICTVLAEESLELVRRHQPDGTSYYPDGRPIAPGSVVRLPGLARALELWADEGAGVVAGTLGEAIVARVQAAGGVLTRADLETARADWTPATSARIGTEQMWVTPAPTHGPSLLDALGTLVRSSSPGDVLAAVNDAIHRRGLSLADPSGTSMVSAADSSGTLVTIVHSNSYPRFGSGLIVGDFDLILANRAGRGFMSTPDHPNFPVVGRRPATTLHAWGLAAANGWRVVGATPGGANQMPWNAQTVARLLGLGGELDASVLAAAVVGPRWQISPSGPLAVEAGFGADELGGLLARDPDAVQIERWGLRSAMQIIADTGGVMVGVVDPRTVGGVIPL